MAVITDRRTPRIASSVVQNYLPDVVQKGEYYSFGADLPGWGSNPEKYSFRFGGQEQSPELGPGNHTALFWEYDAMVGRRWNRDPITKPWMSDYAAFSNNPIIFVDPNGDDHYFDCHGNYVGDDGTESQNIRVITTSIEELPSGLFLQGGLIDPHIGAKNSVALSSLTYDTKASKQLLTNVMSHYGGQLEIEPSAMGVENPNMQIDPVMHAAGNKIFTSVNEDGKMNSGLDDISNFINSLVHEDSHRKTDPSKKDFQPSDHLSEYLTQIDHKSFPSTSPAYKQIVIDGFIKNLSETYNKEGNQIAFDQGLKDFNARSDKTGYKLLPTSEDMNRTVQVKKYKSE